MFKSTRVVNIIALLILCSSVKVDGHIENAEYRKCMVRLNSMSPDNPIYFIVKSICDALITNKEFEEAQEPETPVEQDPSVIVTRRNEIIVITASDFKYNYCLTTIKDTPSSFAVDFDPIEGFVYFGSDGLIAKAKLDGSERQVVTNLTFSLDGMALDWVGRNIYWAFYSSEEADHIGVTTMDGKWTKTLINNETVDSPRGLALDPASGKMYWSEWGENPRIASAYLDGTNIQTLVDTNITWPNGVALDKSRGQIYWGDSKRNEIGVVKTDGSERETLLGPDEFSHTFGFSYLNDYLYWTDWRTNVVERMNVSDTSTRVVILDTFANQYGIKATDQAIPDVTNECAEENGGCSQFCFYTPNGAKCDCADGWFLGPDKRTCEEVAE